MSPRINYYHPRTGRFHTGHVWRLVKYIKGGLSPTDIALLTGVSRKTIYVTAEKFGLAIGAFSAEPVNVRGLRA